MNYETVLLIGGPKDAARISVTKGIPRIAFTDMDHDLMIGYTAAANRVTMVGEVTYRRAPMLSNMGFEGDVYVFDGVDALPALIEGYRKPPVWNSAENPPRGESGLWSEEVAAVTNYGNVFKISYFHGEDSGVWQRPKALLKGEQVEFWMHLPGEEHESN